MPSAGYTTFTGLHASGFLTRKLGKLLLASTASGDDPIRGQANAIIRRHKRPGHDSHVPLTDIQIKSKLKVSKLT